MRRSRLTRACLVALALVAPPAGAQERDTTARATDPQLPRGMARDVATIYNAPGTFRLTAPVRLPVDSVVPGDLAVLGGPVVVAGRVDGQLVVVNGDVQLDSAARIAGDLLVVGGAVEMHPGAQVGGTVRAHLAALSYTLHGERLVADRSDADAESWFERFRPRRRPRQASEIKFGSTGTYNRVEGLPIYLGPRVNRPTSWGGVMVRAVGILRSAERFRWDGANLGHDVDAEVQLTALRGLAIGGELYDVVEGVEQWQLSSLEVGLASFLLHRDFRDYYNRHGRSVRVAMPMAPGTQLELSLADERWSSREVRDPYTLFRDNQGWRPNPRIEEGRMHVATAVLRFDTRNDVDDPWAGWLVNAALERGRGELSPDGLAPAARRTYWRGLLDLRRYNRISPTAQLHLRMVAGGWLGGDDLPLARRLSVDGPGALPGFDFRRSYGAPDVANCNPAGTLPDAGAQCERIVLGQVEYRGDLRFGFLGLDDDSDWGQGLGGLGYWVVFADFGRGWQVGDRADDVTLGTGAFPSLNSFRTDLGVGIDFRYVGLFVAKAVSLPEEPANVFVRLRRRF